MPLRCTTAVLLGAFPLIAAAVDADPPGPTLRDDVKALELTLVDGYAGRRPRMLFGADGLAGLKAKAAAHGEK